MLSGTFLEFTRCDVEGLTLGVKGTAIWNGPNIDADPSFVDLVGRDLHLRAQSPCRDLGASSGVDWEGDPSLGAPDLGADEFHPHLYTLGDPSPGGTLKRIVIGTPGALPVLWFGSFGLAATPLTTPFGPFLLDSALLLPTSPERFGPIPASGFFAIMGVVPAGLSGMTIHAQVWFGGATPFFSNLDVIRFP